MNSRDAINIYLKYESFSKLTIYNLKTSRDVIENCSNQSVVTNRIVIEVILYLEIFVTKVETQ